ncbi:26S proteasome non-ATPase regulatory subunit 14 [Tanacetum coccineum]|uniref:26S proteasome non-ATPase regulatory subunit 14 n=1 Tax=Tanacetum coccineum TaxID=301880 RepID=A0ABQ5A9I1_9ASTR
MSVRKFIHLAVVSFIDAEKELVVSVRKDPDNDHIALVSNRLATLLCGVIAWCISSPLGGIMLQELISDNLHLIFFYETRTVQCLQIKVSPLKRTTLKALIHALNSHYYSMAINYRKKELEEKMLLNLHKKKWTDGLTLEQFDTHSKTNEVTVQVSIY